MKLGAITTTRSGLVLSRKKARHIQGVYYQALNLRCINADGSINLSELDDYFAADLLPASYLTHSGDVVVRLTAPYTAVLIDREYENLVIPSNFMVLQADSQHILPEYLFWLLNTRQSKRALFMNATSNMLGAVKAEYITEFEWDPVPLDLQRTISQINLLSRRESDLLRRLAQEKEKYCAALLQQLQKEQLGGHTR